MFDGDRRCLVSEQPEVQTLGALLIQRPEKTVFRSQSNLNLGQLAFAHELRFEGRVADAELDLERVHGLMASPVIVDGRNVLDPVATRDLGFDYTSVGRP